MMRECVDKKRYIRTGIALCVIATMLGGILLAWQYNERKQEWNAIARETFGTSLKIELEKRSNDSVLIIPVYRPMHQQLNEPIPDSVVLQTEFGRKVYRIPRYKHENSYYKERRKRLVSSVLLKDHPLSADSLQQHWDDLLGEKRIKIPVGVRITTIDLLEQTDTAYSRQVSFYQETDSLLSYYLGHRCEVEVTGYVSSYSMWNVLGTWRVLWVFLWPWLLWGLGYGWYDSLRRLFPVRTKKTVIEKREVIVEKPVYKVEMDNAAEGFIYDLGDGVYFDSRQRTLYCNDEKETIAPQLSILLKQFLNSPRHCLSMDEIDEAMWHGGGNSAKLYKLIQRLRTALERITHLTIRNDGEGVYWLCKKNNKDGALKM